MGTAQSLSFFDCKTVASKDGVAIVKVLFFIVVAFVGVNVRIIQMIGLVLETLLNALLKFRENRFFPIEFTVSRFAHGLAFGRSSHSFGLNDCWI